MNMMQKEALSSVDSGEVSYSIELHHHRFASWAASRAASVKGCRFEVERGRTILESAGFDESFSSLDQLPSPEQFDETHRLWREAIIQAASSEAPFFTHGVAAKLINCYLKSRFVCAGLHAHDKVRTLHPPVDSVLLKALGDLDIGGFKKQWRRADLIRWSKFTSDQYQGVIDLIRRSLNGKPLWMIEEYWKGNQ